VVKVTVPTESFFNFFSPPKAPADDDDTVASDIEERLELDYQLGEDIKEKLIPRAIDWFTGEALQFEELGDELDQDDFEGDDDDEDDDEDDDQRSDNVDEDSDEEVWTLLLFLHLVERPPLILTRTELRSPKRRLPNAKPVEHLQPTMGNPATSRVMSSLILITGRVPHYLFLSSIKLKA
jgi:nucleosome assembly protein 1-like 1